MERIKGVGRIVCKIKNKKKGTRKIMNNVKNTPINWNEELKIEEILTTIGAEDTELSRYYRIGGNKKISSDVFEYIIDTCGSCGVEKYYYSILFCELEFGQKNKRWSIYKELLKDGFWTEKKIFQHQIIDGKHWTIGTKKDWKILPTICIDYEKEEDLIKDMISAANYIKTNLKQREEV